MVDTNFNYNAIGLCIIDRVNTENSCSVGMVPKSFGSFQIILAIKIRDVWQSTLKSMLYRFTCWRQKVLSVFRLSEFLYIFQLNRKVNKRHFCQQHVNLETVYKTNCSEHCQVDFS